MKCAGAPAKAGKVSGSVRDVDPSVLRPDLPGKLSLAFDASGAPFGNKAALDVAFRNLTGQLRGQKASGTGQKLRTSNRDAWQFKDLNLRFGKTHVVLNGSLGDVPDLEFVLDADDLSIIDPEARGRINASGRYAGVQGQRVIQLKARGSGFEWHGSELAGLNADVDIEPGNNGNTEGTIELAGLQYGGRTLQIARLQVTGTNAAQQLALSLTADPLRLAVTAEGSLHDGTVAGTVP